MDIGSGNLGNAGGGMPNLGGNQGGGIPGMGGNGNNNIAGGENNGAKKTGTAGQVSDMLDQGLAAATGGEVSPKVGTDASTLGTKEEVDPETGEVTETPMYNPGDKVGSGKVVGADGAVKGSSTRRLLTDVGTGVATVYGGDEAGKAVYDIGQNSEIVGQISDKLDEMPGVEKLSKEVEESGAMDMAEGGFEAYNAAKSGDIQGAIEGAKKMKDGKSKFKKKIMMKVLMVALPIFFFFMMFFCIVFGTDTGDQAILNADGEYIQIMDEDEVKGTMPGTDTGPGLTNKSDLKLLQYFPDGVPTTEQEMQKYLVTVSVPITDKDGNKKTKSIKLHKDIANQVVSVLQSAQDAGFKVYDIQSYNFRTIRGSTTVLSQHSYGLAIDINPDENYYYNPSQNSIIGKLYEPGKNEYSMPSDGVVVAGFKALGWDWGGDWKSYKDYMHFSVTGG